MPTTNRTRTRASRVAVLAGFLLGLQAAAGCRTPGESRKASRIDLGAVEAIASPATGSATSQQLTASGNRLILSWLELTDARTTLTFAERTNSGWSEPRAVPSATELVANTADVPSVRVLADGTLVAHWLQEDGPDPESYLLPLSWSKDGGRTWSPPTTPHHDGTHTQHGFGTSFQAPGGGLGIIWLDGRATAAPSSGGDIGLWSATFDRDAKQTSETAIEPRACECCQTSVAETSDGAIAAFRGRSADETRDIFVTRLVDGRWTTPAAVHADGWQIDGCPINGPAVTARGRDVVVAWFTAPTGEGQAFVAFSHDAGRTFGNPIRIDEGSATGHVDAELLADGAVAVSFTELVNKQSQVRLRRVDATGSLSPALTIGVTMAMQYPRLAQGRDELLVTWIKSEDLRVGTARVPLTRQ
jgi:BNR repeat-like domain